MAIEDPAFKDGIKKKRGLRYIESAQQTCLQISQP